MTQPPPRSPCPIANALDLFGDRWTLLVLRDLLFFGKTTFGEMLASPEGISTNILADRLKSLEAGALIERRPVAGHGRRFTYHPTAKGRSLAPILRLIVDWGLRELPGTALPGRSSP